MTKPLSEQVVVITGASSGIGRQTALMMAERGATLVLAARNGDALLNVARQVEQLGATAYPVVTDVSSWEQMQRLRDAAVARFGRIDTWVNDASVAMYSTIAQTTAEEMRRVVEVNLLGVMYGSKLAAEQMRQSGGGTIINVSSVLGEVAVPFQGAYVAAKHGVRGFNDTLRLELARENSGIVVTTIMPSSVNTPFFNNARSKMGVKPRPIAPTYQPETVARAIIFAAENPRREIVVGFAGKFFIAIDHLSRSLLDTIMLAGDWMGRGQQTDEPDEGFDNLDQPSEGTGRTHGDFDKESMPISLYTDLLETRPAVKRALLAGLAAGVFALALRGRR